jgi:hypothetical protein
MRMFDQETIDQLNQPPPRRPVFWPAWRQDFELGLSLALLDRRLALTPWERLLENDRSLALHHSVNRASPFCHDLDQFMIQKLQRVTPDL